MKFEDVIMKRHSTRSFKKDPVTREKIEFILECGKHAPNARGLHNWQFTVIDQAEKIQALADLLKEELQMDRPYNMYAPPVLILVSDKRDDRNGAANCACALQNMFLGAESQGLSSVWINQLKDICDRPAVRKILTEYGVPEDHVVGGVAAIGYEDEAKPRPEKKAAVHWVK